MVTHGATSDWVPEAAYFIGHWFDSWDEAHEAERQAIRVENPLYNRVRYPVAPLREPLVIEVQAADGRLVRF